MKRLTEVDGKGNWHIAGVEWGNVKGNLYGALCKLKDYEDTGLSPHDVERLNTFDGSQAIKATAKLQEEWRKHQWTPVEEQLPEHDGLYLACLDDGYISSVEYDTDESGRQAWELWADSGEVIAWMPLPEPYKPQALQYADNDTAQPGLMPAT